jgi:Zn-dependent protease
VLGIPVRVSAGFWLMSVVLGASSDDWRRIVVWTIVVFVSIMVHELGHALTARAFGASPVIVLHAMGGLTIYGTANITRKRSGLISAAGPAAGLLLGGIVWIVAHRTGLYRASPMSETVVETLLWVNIGWGLINLLPVIPFDGGHILASVLGPKRSLATILVSAFVGAAVCAFALSIKWNVPAILFGWASLSAIMPLRGAWARRADAKSGLEAKVKEARRLLDAGDPDRAYDLALSAATAARTQPVRDAAFIVIAWVHVTRGEGGRAREALAQLSPEGAVDPYTLAAVEDAAGNRLGAQQVLEMARDQGLRTAAMTKLLIDLYARVSDLGRAARLAAEDADILAPGDARLVVDAAMTGGEPRAAALVAERLFAIHGQPDDALAQARALTMSGDRDAAFDALARAVTKLAPERILALATDPVLAPLADDERFRRLLGS